MVVTTNFDNLVADAMAIHASRSPLIVGHEALAGFARPQLRRPLVAKIHRDLHLAPKTTEKASTPWDKAGATACRNYSNTPPPGARLRRQRRQPDGLLNDLPAGHIPGRLFWCYRDEPPPRMLATIAKHSGVIVKISGFDEFMQELVKQVLLSSWGSWCGILTSWPKNARKNLEAIKKTLTAGGLSNWPSETDMDKREAIYREGLKKFPQSAELAGNFANFLDQRHDYDEAERYYRKALELDPSHAAHTGNFANFLASQRHDYDKAEHYYRKALELGPNDPYALANFAHLRLLRRQGDDLA